MKITKREIEFAKFLMERQIIHYKEDTSCYKLYSSFISKLDSIEDKEIEEAFKSPLDKRHNPNIHGHENRSFA